MSANVIAFTGRIANRIANRNATPLPALAAIAATDRRDNVVPMAGWREQARPRRTPTGVFFTTNVLATPGFIA